MACKVFEISTEGEPQPSIRYQSLFDTIEGNASNKEKAIKYSLLDGFTEYFTVNSNGDLITKGDIKDPKHIVNSMNTTIARYFKPNGSVEKFLTAKKIGINRYQVSINDSFFQPIETLAKQAYIPEVTNEQLEEAFKQLIAPKVAEMEEEFVETQPLSRKQEAFKDIPNLADQVRHLINTFSAAGIVIRVNFDDTIDTKGKAKANSDGTVNITLNPDLMTEDTHIHEFSHILIDLLGEDNALVKQALNLVKGTDLYTQVAEAYPELSEQALAKETLVTSMGILGARRQKGKSVFETAINKFIRAIKSFFGIEDNAVETLLDKLFSKRLNANEFTGTLTEEEQNSKVLNKKISDIKDLMKLTTETLQSQLMRLEALPIKNDDVIVQIKSQLSTFKNIQETNDDAKKKIKGAVAKAEQVEDFIGFVDYMSRVVKTNEESINYMMSFSDESLINMSEEERCGLLNTMYHLGNNIQDFFGGGDNSIASKLQGSIEDRKTSRINSKQQIVLSSMEEKVDNLVKKLRSQQMQYKNIGTVLTADLILEYSTPEINSDIEVLIDNIKTNKRLIAIKRDEEYYKLKEDLKEKKITQEDYETAMIDLNIQQLKNKKISRETLINELRDAQLDKSAYSLYMDPLIYSSQVSLQLFTSMVKNKLYQASADTRDVIDELAPAYKEFAEFKGSDLDPTSFNSDILETQTYYIRDTSGKMKPMQMLSFVQPYNVTKFHEDEYQMRKSLKTKYAQPEYGTTEYRDWAKSDAGARFFTEVANWYKKNTIVTQEGVETVADLDARIKDLNKKMVGVQSNPDLAAIYEAHKLDLLQQKARMFDSKNDQYKGIAVRPNSNYANPKYTALMSNPNSPAAKYYTALLKVYHEHQKMSGKQIPHKNDWDKVSYVVPSVEAQGLEKLQGDNYNVFKSTKDFANREFAFLSTDDSYGAVINANKEQRNKIVPVHYINPTEARFVSHDVGSTVVLYAGMANMFKRKSQITGAVIMMRDLVEGREILEQNVQGNPVLSAAAKAAGVNRFTRKKGVSNNFQHLSEFIDKEFFGEKEIKQEFNILGRVVNVNKVVNKLATFSALNTLALNALQATNQFLIDNEKLAEEAVAGQFFDTKNLTWAKVTYTKSMLSGETVSDAGKFNKETKLARFIQEFDLLGVELSNYTEKRTGNRALKAVDTQSLFILQHMAEHETAVTRGLALADTYKGKLKDKNGEVIKNADGSEANLYDVFDKDASGKWKIDPRVANFKPIQMINLVSGVYKKTNQIKTAIDDPILNRRWYGKALLMYRRYFQPGLRKRFGFGDQIHLDTEVNGISEGMYISFGRYVKESVSKGLKFGSVYQILSPMEKQNVKRTSMELGFKVTATAIAAVALGMMSDDDDDDDYAAAFVAYQAMRISSELSQFYNPMEFYRFASSPTALSKPFINSMKLVDHLIFKEIPYRTGLRDEDGIYYERKSGKYEKGDLKLIKMLEDLAPIFRGLDKSSNPQESLKFFIAPPGVS